MNERDLVGRVTERRSVKPRTGQVEPVIKLIHMWKEAPNSRQATKLDLLDIARALRLQVTESWSVPALRMVIRGHLEAIER